MQPHLSLAHSMRNYSGGKLEPANSRTHSMQTMGMEECRRQLSRVHTHTDTLAHKHAPGRLMRCKPDFIRVRFRNLCSARQLFNNKSRDVCRDREVVYCCRRVEWVLLAGVRMVNGWIYEPSVDGIRRRAWAAPLLKMWWMERIGSWLSEWVTYRNSIFPFFGVK
jgi:hypothetical protein